LRLYRWVLILKSFGIGIAITLQLVFYPIERRSITVSPLAAVTEPGQTLERGFVSIQRESPDHNSHNNLGKNTRITHK
jgi:hypothetical protein